MNVETVGAQRKDRVPVALIICLGSLAVWSIPFSNFVPGDFVFYLGPWFDHIVAAGPIRAFAAPFGNYSPPYLYLLAAVSLLKNVASHCLLIKLLSTVGAASLSFAAYRLAKTAGVSRPGEVALWTFLLPSVVMNVPVLGQADTFWVAPCLLSLNASIRHKSLQMALWAGLAFAFKAQAAFLAPFVVAMLIQRRASWYCWLAPPGVYLVAITPAWLAGWPLSDLLTVYVRQSQWNYETGMPFVGDAANAWVVGSLLDIWSVSRFMWIGYVAASVAVVAYVTIISRRNLNLKQIVAAAALSSIMLPWLMPKMHERFFILGEILAFVYAFICRSLRGFKIAALMQLEAITAVYGFLISRSDLAVAGALFVLAAAILLIDDLFVSERTGADGGHEPLRHA